MLRNIILQVIPNSGGNLCSNVDYSFFSVGGASMLFRFEFKRQLARSRRSFGHAVVAEYIDYRSQNWRF